MRRAAVAALVAGLAAAAAAAELPASLLDAAADRVHTRTSVPGRARKVGEVRLVERGRATVVQTLLATRVLRRVVDEIREKEAANWPAGAAGADDMRAYVDALAATAAELARARDGGDGERRIRLAIEFVASADAAGVALVAFDGDEVDGWLDPGARRPLATRTLGRPYVLRNMRLVLADAFHLPEAEVGRLGPLGPAAADPPPAP